MERLQEAPLSAPRPPVTGSSVNFPNNGNLAGTRARSAALISVIDVSLSINERVLLAERDTEK